MNSYNSSKRSTRQITKDVFSIWKHRGETLAKCIERFKKELNCADVVPCTYAGRLDPMAEGIVIILTGEKRFEKEYYSAMDKVYEYTVLFGIATDTYDTLGMVTDEFVSKGDVVVTKESVTEALYVIEKEILSYPPFSSKTIEGVPLFIHARTGTLPSTLPLQHGKIKESTITCLEQVSFSEYVQKAIEDVQKVEGDFRQEGIVEQWRLLQSKHQNVQVSLATITTEVSSGTYIRSIAHRLGEVLGIPAVTYTIKRTAIHIPEDL